MGLTIALLTAIFIAIMQKPCLWGLMKHNWRDNGRFEYCSRCQLMREKGLKKGLKK